MRILLKNSNLDFIHNSFLDITKSYAANIQGMAIAYPDIYKNSGFMQAFHFSVKAGETYSIRIEDENDDVGSIYTLCLTKMEGDYTTNKSCVKKILLKHTFDVSTSDRWLLKTLKFTIPNDIDCDTLTLSMKNEKYGGAGKFRLVKIL